MCAVSLSWSWWTACCDQSICALGFSKVSPASICPAASALNPKASRLVHLGMRKLWSEGRMIETLLHLDNCEPSLALLFGREINSWRGKESESQTETKRRREGEINESRVRDVELNVVMVPICVCVSVFAVFSFTSVIGIINALQQDGFIKGFMDIYISKGEPHLSSAHCIMMSYWDGVVHYGLLLVMIHRMSAGKSFRSMALLWAGSMIASQIVFIPGIVVGKYGKNILPAFWRIAPSLVLPIWAAVKLLSRPRELSIIPADKVEVEQKRALFSRPSDLMLTLGLFITIIFTAFRGFVILECSLDFCFSYIYQYEPYMKDSVGFPKVMMLVFLFYVLPLMTACVYGLYTPGCTWMLDWTLILAGAVAQTQWTHLGASVHSRTPFTYRIPREEWRTVVALNLLYAALPVLLAVRCYTDQAFFMKSVPQGQASNGKKKN